MAQSAAHPEVTLRVLIITEYLETAQMLRKWIMALPALRVIGMVTSAREGVEQARRHMPDLILLDLFLPDADGLEFAGYLMDHLPAQIVLISEEDSRAVMQQALDTGVHGFLHKPLQSDEVMRTLERVVRSAGRQGTGPLEPGGGKRAHAQQVIAVCGAKGGVGTSIIATNLAVALAGMPSDVMLMDARLRSGDDHILLHMENTPTSLDIIGDPQDLDADLLQRAAPAHASKLHLFRAPDSAETVHDLRRETFRAIAREAREQFDIVVADTDNDFSDAAETILEMASRILIVTTPELTAINRLKAFTESLRLRGIESDRCWLIGNRMDGGFHLSANLVEQSLSRRFAAQIPDDVRAVDTSVSRGEPFVLWQRRSGVARAVSQLAARLYHDLLGSAGSARP